MLIGSDTQIQAARGATLQNAGAVNSTMLRTGNAEFSSAAAGIPGVWIYCADQVSDSATGTLRYTHSGTTLAWRAPDQSAFGSEVSIASVTTPATMQVLTLTSGSHSIYVVVSPSAARTQNLSRTVRLEPVTGARAVSWTRNGTIRTVTETAHGRRIGDFVSLFSSTGAELIGYILAVTVDTWTIADTGNAGSGTSRAYGVRDIRIYAAGATFDYRKTGRTANDDGPRASGIILHAISDSEIDCSAVNNCAKYGVFVSGYKNLSVMNPSTFRDDSSTTSGNSDLFHICGPGRFLSSEGARAQSGDNMIGIGTGDYSQYALHLPAHGDLSIEDTRIERVYSDESNMEIVRIYAANAGWVRRLRVDGVSGTVSSSTTTVIRTLTEPSSTTVDGGNTNIDGLTISNVYVTRTNGTEVQPLAFLGTGTLRGVSLSGVLWPAVGVTVADAVQVSRTIEDMSIDIRQGDYDVCGIYLGIRSTGRIKSLNVRDVAITRANAAARGGNHRPTAIYLIDSAAQVDQITVQGGTIIDTSSTGNAACLIRNGGKKSNISVRSFLLTSTTPGSRRADSLLRLDSAAEVGSTVSFVGVQNEANFGIAIDGGTPALVDLSGYTQPGGNVLHGAVGSAATLRVGGSGVSVASLLSATLTNINVDVRNALPCDGSRAVGVSGSLITNTNAGFSTGTGLYYHTGAAWTKVA